MWKSSCRVSWIRIIRLRGQIVLKGPIVGRLTSEVQNGWVSQQCTNVRFCSLLKKNSLEILVKIKKLVINISLVEVNELFFRVVMKFNFSTNDLGLWRVKTRTVYKVLINHQECHCIQACHEIKELGDDTVFFNSPFEAFRKKVNLYLKAGSHMVYTYHYKFMYFRLNNFWE